MRPCYVVLEQAAEWYAVLQSERVTLQERRAWQAWLVEPEHIHAWREIERISARFQGLADDPAARQCSARLPRAGLDRRQALRLLGLVGVGAALTVSGAASLPWREWNASQRTRTGEIREVALAAGARLWLNTNSAAEVVTQRNHAQIEIFRGEILLESGRQPLSLRSGHGLLHAVAGSQLSVREGPGEMQLHLFSGQVQATPAQHLQSVVVEAGQQVSLTARQLLPRGQVHASRRAWSSGVLLADNLRLDEFIQELAGYRHGYLGCDPRVGHLRVVGAYPLDDVDRVLGALATTLPVRIQRRMPWWVSVEPV
ncbi:DUF4880 domain-containing protein [Halopseudomonas pelagia]|uniref:DUF4880 domain-containing protein n=1 Tax=Halopseudomonas pelagia TaxID=553151 RepID=UPI0003B3D131|nr:FecR domain-containing protein [Halopseudomonas pelagia]|tara:strand:+ start:51343 stop:52281 length:939 start_codon:yes stop_codon:yes gene_type:complete